MREVDKKTQERSKVNIDDQKLNLSGRGMGPGSQTPAPRRINCKEVRSEAS
jgi:hypothetical protein